MIEKICKVQIFVCFLCLTTMGQSLGEPEKPKVVQSSKSEKKKLIRPRPTPHLTSTPQDILNDQSPESLDKIPNLNEMTEDERAREQARMDREMAEGLKIELEEERLKKEKSQNK